MNNPLEKARFQSLDSFIFNSLDKNGSKQLVLDTIAKAGLLAAASDIGDRDDRQEVFVNLLLMYEHVSKLDVE